MTGKPGRIAFRAKYNKRHSTLLRDDFFHWMQMETLRTLTIVPNLTNFLLPFLGKLNPCLKRIPANQSVFIVGDLEIS